MRVVDLGRRMVFAAMSVLVVGATFLPTVASAQQQVTGRSIEMSSPSPLMPNTHYTVKFTPAVDAEAFAVYFCKNSPLIGQDCTAPTGMVVTGAASTTSGFTNVTGTGSRVVVGGEITANSEVSVEITGITNPSEVGQFYARIVTYDTVVNAAAGSATALGTGALDRGSVALAITHTVGVSGTVLETMLFCVSGMAIEADCKESTVTDPVLVLGEESGGVTALVPGVVSEGNLYTQITTNAAGGAIVWLKSTAVQCGGLLLAGAPTGTCHIEPAGNADITGATVDARFGVKTSDATNAVGATSTTGAFQPASGSIYSNSQFALNYVDETEGVTSTFGDKFLDTNSLPVNNKNMMLTFGVKVTNDTPAGTYSTDLSLIATGKF